MKITISNDQGEVYVIADFVEYDQRNRQVIVADEEGDQLPLNDLLKDAIQWENLNK